MSCMSCAETGVSGGSRQQFAARTVAKDQLAAVETGVGPTKPYVVLQAVHRWRIRCDAGPGSFRAEHIHEI